MPAGTVLDWHTHEDHQLARAAQGVLTVRSGSSAWVLPSTRALWIPVGVPHETLSANAATMRSAYIRSDRCAIQWSECTPVVVTDFMAQLLEYLTDDELDAGQRARAESFLVDLVEPVSVVSFDVRMPTEERSRRVAEQLVENPLTVGPWRSGDTTSVRAAAPSLELFSPRPTSRSVGGSLLRRRAAMDALADGVPVATVAHFGGLRISERVRGITST